MRYFIDTNIFLFYIREKDRLNKNVLDTIEESSNSIYISSKSIEELGKLTPIPDHKDPVDHAIMAHAITNKATLISSDGKMRFYKNQGLNFIWNRV